MDEHTQLLSGNLLLSVFHLVVGSTIPPGGETMTSDVPEPLSSTLTQKTPGSSILPTRLYDHHNPNSTVKFKRLQSPVQKMYSLVTQK